MDVNRFPYRNLIYSHIVPSDSFLDALCRKGFLRFWFYSPSEAFRSEIHHVRCPSLTAYSVTALLPCFASHSLLLAPFF